MTGNMKIGIGVVAIGAIAAAIWFMYYGGDSTPATTTAPAAGGNAAPSPTLSKGVRTVTPERAPSGASKANSVNAVYGSKTTGSEELSRS